MTNVTQPGIVYAQEPIKGISIVIPCKNEGAAVRQTVEDIRKAFKESPLDYEIIVVDDGSTDNTRSEALAAGARVLVHPINMGYGNAIMDGIVRARYDAIGIIDADGTYPADFFPRLVERADRYDMVIGMRTWSKNNTTLFARCLRRMLSWVILYFTDQRAMDYNSGFRVFHKHDLLNYRPILCPTFSFTTSLTLLYLLLCRNVCFIDVSYGTRVGKSKVSYLHDAVRTFCYIFLITSLFQPYRLAVFLMGMAIVGQGILLGLSRLLRLSATVLMGLEWMFLALVVVSVVALVAYPISKLYLIRLRGAPEQ